MASANPRSLAAKLNASCRRALEGAAGLCLSRTNYNVEIEHWLLKLLEPANTDLTRIMRHYDVDPSRVNRELTKSLDQLRTGNARAPELSPELLDLMRVGSDKPESERGMGDQMDVFADQAARQLAQIDDQVIEVQDTRCYELLACEGQ